MKVQGLYRSLAPTIRFAAGWICWVSLLVVAMLAVSKINEQRNTAERARIERVEMEQRTANQNVLNDLDDQLRCAHMKSDLLKAGNSSQEIERQLRESHCKGDR